MGCRGEFQRKPEEVKWVAGASCGSGKHDGGFQVAGGSSGASECVDGSSLGFSDAVVIDPRKCTGSPVPTAVPVSTREVSGSPVTAATLASALVGSCLGFSGAVVIDQRLGGCYPNSDSWLRQDCYYP